MTWPVTPDPAIHDDTQSVKQQQIFSQQQILTWAEQLPLAMIKTLVDAILAALGLGGVVPTANNIITDVYNALLDIPQGNISGLIGSLEDIVGTIVDALGGNSAGKSLNGLLAEAESLLGGVGSSIANLPATILSIIENLPIISTILQLLGIGGNTGSGSTGTTGTQSGGGTTTLQPLTLTQLIGLLGTNTTISPSQLTALAPTTEKNVLADSTFQTGAYIQGQGLWCWDGWFGSGQFAAPGGSIRTIRPGRIVIYNIVGTSQGVYMWGNEPVGQAGVGILLEYARTNIDGWLGNALLWALENTDPTYFEWINVPYPAASYPMGPSVLAGHDWLVTQINQTPGPFFFVMDSQGNQVGASVYDEIRYGTLQSRNNDFLGALALGNLRREEGHYFPGCPDLAPGTSGMCPVGLMTTGPYAGSGSITNPAVGNLIDTEDRWWDFAVPGDYFACTPINGVTVDPGPDAVGGNVGDIPGISGALLREFYKFVNYNNTSASIIANWLYWAAQNGIFSGIDIIEGFLGAPMQQIDALGGADSPHQSYYKDTRPLASKGDNRTFLEIGTDYLNSFVGGVHPDGTPIMPPPVNGVRHQMLGQRVAAKPGDVIVAGAQVMWVNVECPTDAIIVGVNAYDANGNLIAEIGGSDVTPGATITNPPASSNWAWLTLQAEFEMPEQTASACLLLDVEPLAMETGIVWFTNCVFDQTNLVAGELIDQTTLSKITGEQVTGPQGEADMATAIINLLNGYASAQNQANVTGVSMAQAIQSVAQTAYLAAQANDLGVVNNQILSNPSTKPLYNGLQPTGDATFQLTNFQPGATLNTISIPSGTSLFGFINCTATELRGFIKFMATSSGASGTYVNIYSVNQTSGALTNLYSTSDISSEIPNGYNGWVGITLPGASQVGVTIGEWIAIEIVSNSSAISVMGEQWAFPNDSTTVLANLSATRTVSTKGVSPSSLMKSDISFGNTIPWILFAISAAPPAYQPPSQTSLSASSTYTIPSWLKSGDFLDVVLVGAGGAGGLSTPNANGQGALPGTWAAQTFTYGTDIPVGTTDLSVYVGNGGCAPSGSGGPTFLGYGTATAPIFDSIGSGGHVPGLTGTSLSFPFTASAGAYVLVGLSTSHGTFNVTYGSTTMTPIGLAYMPGPTGPKLFLFELQNAPGGTNTITATFTAPAADAAANAISFTNTSGAALVTNVSGSGTSLSQTVECDTNQIAVQIFGNEGYGQLGSFTGGTHISYTNNYVAPYYHDGVSISYASATTTFGATASSADNWAGVSVVLNPAIPHILLSASGGASGGAGDLPNPANTQTDWTGLGPGNDNFGGRLYVGGSTTVSTHFGGNPPGGGSSGGDSSYPSENGANGQAWITARQAAYVPSGTGAQNPVTAAFTAHGTFTYNVPSWAQYLDFILLGGGGSGAPGQYTSPYATGLGGNPGTWTTATISASSGWPSGGVINVTVGKGGAELGTDGVAANPGGSSNVSAPGMSTYTAAGGSGYNANSNTGIGPGNQSYGGSTYYGATAVPVDNDGNSPGGAGAGGTANASQYYFGGAGGDGAVWIVARQS